MAQLFKNNASAVLAASATNVATTLTLVAGQGARFPAPAGGDFFLLTLLGIDGNGAENAWEIVKVTARAVDTLTVVRAQEGTAAAVWGAGTTAQARATAGSLAALEPTIVSGLVSQYWAGDKTWRDLLTDVRAATLTGLSTASGAVVAAADTVLGALGKLQRHISDNVAAKDASSGYPGLTLFKLNLRNAANTLTSFFATAATVARTWTLPDKDGTVAMTSDITGTNSGTNTGDQTNITGTAQRLGADTADPQYGDGVMFRQAAVDAAMPDAGWWSALRLLHANASGYYIDIAGAFHADALAFRRNTAGAKAPWKFAAWSDGVNASGNWNINASTATALSAGADRTKLDGLTGAMIANTPAGNIAAVTVQAAINELDTEKASKSSLFALDLTGSILAGDMRNTSNPMASVGYGAGVRFRFGTMEDDGGSNYADVMDLSTNNGSAGGGINALYFGKNSQKVLHKYAGVGATAWTTRMLYSQGNIVGPVGQSAGVPTGAVIERGSNGNGEYVRFADGLQICWLPAFTGHTVGTALTRSLPASFVAAPAVVYSITPSGSVASGVAWGSTTTASFQGSTTDTFNVVTLVCFGRWF